MSIWLYKKNDNSDNFKLNGEVNSGDIIYIYLDDEVNGGFIIKRKLLIKNDSTYEIVVLPELKQIDIPYSVFYQTKTNDSMIKLSDKEIEFILNEKLINSLSSKGIKEQFAEYINNYWDIETKKVEKRIDYLDKLLPEKLAPNNPISIFEIFDLNKLQDIVITLKKGNINYEWDRSKGGGGEVQQTLNQYIRFLEKLKNEKLEMPIEKIDDNILFENEISKKNLKDDPFLSFIKKIEQKDDVNFDKKINNIEFIIGQPNTGKSYNFEESRLFNVDYKDHYMYLKIPVSGGIGNEYKGLQNTDLALSYDPIKKELRFGEFLQILMSAIVNPNVPHVIFLDDFHNQDISSLLSEYTPLFKSQQKRNIPSINLTHEIFNQKFNSTDEFIVIWNKFIETHCINIPKVPITNRISGKSLYLVYPSNFYLLGAANFNQNSLNIFADWEDRARIQYKQPIEDFLKTNTYQKIKDDAFFKCCLTLNNELKNILEENNIFDNEKYCFGMWKIFDYKQNLINDLEEQKELIKFFFGMIKNSLRFNNKNSLINTIGKDLFNVMQKDDWFIENIQKVNQDLEDKEFFKILHTYNIYEEDI
jgi:hypothetical protein